MKLVLVEWIDSVLSVAGWHEMEEIRAPKKPARCWSVGWLASKTKDCTVLVPHIGEKDEPDTTFQGYGDLIIPTRAIVKMKILASNGRPK